MLMMVECRVVLWREPRVDGCVRDFLLFFSCLWKKGKRKAKRRMLSGGWAKERTEPRLFFLAYQEKDILRPSSVVEI